MSKKQKLWNPKASTCSECPKLQPIKDKKSKTVDPHKKLCTQWTWEIDNTLAEQKAVCRVEPEKRRKRR